MELHPQNMQLLFVHLQPSVVEASLTQKPSDIERAASALMKGADLLAIPVSFALVPEEDRSPVLLQSFSAYAAPANSFVSALGNPWLDIGLVARVQGTSRRTIILAGFSTEVAVLHTALAALKDGFRVLIPVDAVGCASTRVEHTALTMIQQKGGEITAAASILSALAPDFSKEPGLTMLSLIKEINAPGAGNR